MCDKLFAMKPKKTVVIVGFGFMGRVHAACWRRVRGVRIAAVCVRDPAVLGKSVKVYGCVGNALAADLPDDVAVYTDLAAMLDEVKPDYVDITLPTALHAPAVELALARGAHVLCEKPLARNAREADRIVRAVAAAKGRFLVAQSLRFASEYAFLKKLVATGRYGAATGASFFRLTPPPCAPSGGTCWFRDERNSGGLALDLNVHDTDVVRWLFGMPAAVTARGHRRGDGLMDHLAVSYDYPDKVVTAEASWGGTESFGFEFGFKVFLERATVVLDLRRTPSFLVYPANGRPYAPKFRASDCYQAEIDFFHRYAAGKADDAANPAPLDEILDSLALIDAIRKSAEKGLTITVVGEAAR